METEKEFHEYTVIYIDCIAPIAHREELSDCLQVLLLSVGVGVVSPLEVGVDIMVGIGTGEEDGVDVGVD